MVAAARISLQKNYRLLLARHRVCTTMSTFKKGVQGGDRCACARDVPPSATASRKGFERERAFPGATIITPNGQRESGSQPSLNARLLAFSQSPRIKSNGLTDTNLSPCVVSLPPSCVRARVLERVLRTRVISTILIYAREERGGDGSSAFSSVSIRGFRPLDQRYLTSA